MISGFHDKLPDKRMNFYLTSYDLTLESYILSTFFRYVIKAESSWMEGESSWRPCSVGNIAVAIFEVTDTFFFLSVFYSVKPRYFSDFLFCSPLQKKALTSPQNVQHEAIISSFQPKTAFTRQLFIALNISRTIILWASCHLTLNVLLLLALSFTVFLAIHH